MPFRIPTITLALLMDTVLYFNQVTPYSKKLSANFCEKLSAPVPSVMAVFALRLQPVVPP